jgi:hypothetical protein
VPDLKAKNFNELEAIAGTSVNRFWIYSLAILQKLAEQMQQEMLQLKNQQSAPTPPAQP